MTKLFTFQGLIEIQRCNTTFAPTKQSTYDQLEEIIYQSQDKSHIIYNKKQRVFVWGDTIFVSRTYFKKFNTFFVQGTKLVF